MHARTCMHTRTCTCTCARVHAYAYMCARGHVHIHLCTRARACTHTLMSIHVCTCVHVHMHICTRMHVHAYVCAHVHVHTCVHIGTQTYIHTCQSGRQSLGHRSPASWGWCAAEAGILCFLPLLPTPRPQSPQTLTSRVFPKRKESHFVSKAPGAFVVLPPLVTGSARKELRGTQRVPCPLSAVISICNSTPSCCLTGRRTPNSCDHLSLQGSDSTVSLSRSIPFGGTEPLRQTSPEQQRSFRAVTGDPTHCPQAPPNPAHLRVPMPM